MSHGHGKNEGNDRDEFYPGVKALQQAFAPREAFRDKCILDELEDFINCPPYEALT